MIYPIYPGHLGLAGLVLPRRLTPDLPPAYSPAFLQRGKAPLRGTRGDPVTVSRIPLGVGGLLPSPICGGFAPGAPHRAWALVSGPIWGLPLSRPLPVIGLAGRYPANYHDGPQPHPRAPTPTSRCGPLGGEPFQASPPIGD